MDGTVNNAPDKIIEDNFPYFSMKCMLSLLISTVSLRTPR